MFYFDGGLISLFFSTLYLNDDYASASHPRKAMTNDDDDDDDDDVDDDDDDEYFPFGILQAVTCIGKQTHPLLSGPSLSHSSVLLYIARTDTITVVRVKA
jgi:hypothetical protein